MYIIGHPLLAIVQIIHHLISLYVWIILISVVLSWVNADPYNPIVRILHMLTEPVFRFVKRYIPTTFGAADLTPIVVILLLKFIDLGILPIFGTLAQKMIS